MPFKMKQALILLCLALTLTLQSAEPKAKAESPVDPNSLYARIGGQPAINAAVDLFYTKVLADKRVNHFFEDVNMRRQHNKQKAFLAAALGGPVPYEGRGMRKAHADLHLTEAHFNAIAEHLQATLTELKVEKKLIAEVMAVVATTKNDVLNRPSKK